MSPSTVNGTASIETTPSRLYASYGLFKRGTAFMSLTTSGSLGESAESVSDDDTMVWANSGEIPRDAPIRHPPAAGSSRHRA